MVLPSLVRSRPVAVATALFALPSLATASESKIKIPDLDAVSFFGGALSGVALLRAGLAVCLLGLVFGWLQYWQTKRLPVHPSMSAISRIIWETCKTYLWQQGKFLIGLWGLIALCIAYYFGVLERDEAAHVLIILAASVLGILGSYGVAWFGIRINTVANSRTAFAALRGYPLRTLTIPLRSGSYCSPPAAGTQMRRQPGGPACPASPSLARDGSARSMPATSPPIHGCGSPA